MGQALKRATRVSVTEEIGGMLQMTPINEEMLRMIIAFIEQLPERYPDEAKLIFKKPLSWSTSLSFAAFTGDDYITRFVYKLIWISQSNRYSKYLDSSSLFVLFFQARIIWT